MFLYTQNHDCVCNNETNLAANGHFFTWWQLKVFQTPLVAICADRPCCTPYIPCPYFHIKLGSNIKLGDGREQEAGDGLERHHHACRLQSKARQGSLYRTKKAGKAVRGKVNSLWFQYQWQDNYLNPNFHPRAVERDLMYEPSSAHFVRALLTYIKSVWSSSFLNLPNPLQDSIMMLYADYVDKCAMGPLYACTKSCKVQKSQYRAAKSIKNEVFLGFLGRWQLITQSGEFLM